MRLPTDLHLICTKYPNTLLRLTIAFLTEATVAERRKCFSNSAVGIPSTILTKYCHAQLTEVVAALQ